MISYLRSSSNMICLIFSLKTSCLSKHACIYRGRDRYNTLIKMKPLSLALQCGWDGSRRGKSRNRNYTLEDYHLATKGLESGLVLLSKKDNQEATQQCVCLCVCACMRTCACAYTHACMDTHTCTWGEMSLFESSCCFCVVTVFGGKKRASDASKDTCTYIHAWIHL